MIRNYIVSTSFHGYKFIGQKDRHRSERLFWTVCCLSSVIGTTLLIKSSWNDFQNNAISFVVETSYLDWNTSFPSIAVCEVDNPEGIATTTDKLYGDPHDYNLDEIVKELIYYRGLSFYTLQICGPEAQFPSQFCQNNTMVSMEELTSMVRSTCGQIFKKCSWNGHSFDCCKYFGELNTEMGVCYTINSLQVVNDKKMPRYPMVSNIRTGPGALHLELYGYSNVYILGDQEVPSLTSLMSDTLGVTPGIFYRRFFTIKEIENQPEVQDVSIEQRKCRFTHESSNMDVYPHYSYSSCSVQCRKNAQIKTCGCTHHLVPSLTPNSDIPTCNITGLYCLNTNYNALSVLKPSWANRSGLICDCLPSCTEIELSTVKDDKSGTSNDYATVELTLERLPSERYKRYVVRGNLDLVVSMGGTTALFLGASILSFVEIVYYFVVVPVTNLIKERAKVKRYR